MSTATQTPTSSLHRTSHNNYEIQSQRVLQNRSGVEQNRNNAKMLVILVTGEQRLITFKLPKESCTVQDLLEQVGVPFDSTTTIRCVENPGEKIDFVVTVGFSVKKSASELISRSEQNSQIKHQKRSGNKIGTSVAASLNATPVVTDMLSLSGVKSSNVTSDIAAVDELSQKIIPGYNAVCQKCGFSGYDRSKCERCKQIFHEMPKLVKSNDKAAPGATGSDTDQKHVKASNEITTESLNASTGERGLAETACRRRIRSGLQTIVSEPEIVTLSSDEEVDYGNSKTGERNVSSANSSNMVGTLSINCKPFSLEPIIQEKDETPINAACETAQTLKSTPETRLYSETIKTEECANSSLTEFERCDVTDLSNFSRKLIISLKCKLIRIGTYSFESKENVTFTSKGIKIVAPLCNDATVLCSLHICKPEVVKIIAHFSHNSDSMFCFYTLRTCAQYIRTSLNMKDAESKVAVDCPAYFCAHGPYQMRKIILQFESISEEAIKVIKAIWGFFDEISFTAAQDLLKRAAHADSQATGKSNEDSLPTTVHLNPNEIRQLLIYPPGKGGISINTEDYMCLATDQYLNDIIIDFYLKWVHNNVIPDSQREKIFIFSTFFYKRLTTLTRVQDKELKQTSAQKRHARVQNWTKNVNLFDKDFIIIPINEQSHWFLAIYCFPKLKGPVTFDTNIPVRRQQLKKQKSKKYPLQIDNTTVRSLSKRENATTGFEDSDRDEAEGDESDLASDDSDFDSAVIYGNNNNNNNSNNKPASSVNNLPQTQSIKQPLILIFDSLAGASRSRVFATLRDYLTCEYNLKMSANGPHTFTKDNMPGHCVKVPQQNNYADCGLYLLQYVENFFKVPIKDYRLPIKQLNNWFDTTTVTKKREDIAILLQKLMNEENGPNQQVILPKIPFPTLNGQLVEQEESCDAEYYEFEGKMDEEVSEDADATIYNTSDVENTSVKKNCKTSASTAARPLALLPPKNGCKYVAKRRMQISGSNIDNSSESTKPGSRNKLKIRKLSSN